MREEAGPAKERRKINMSTTMLTTSESETADVRADASGKRGFDSDTTGKLQKAVLYHEHRFPFPLGLT
eukprot:1992304-Rhodomonas_salina.1